MRPKILALVLAAGKGGRMGPLTEDRAKPNLPFGGTYHLIDFPLTNCVHSGIHDVWVVQQHHPHGLTDHLANGRPWDLDRTTGGFRTLHPFTDRASENWQQGNAHALYTHLRFIEDFGPDLVLVLSADHIYSYDYRDAIDAHVERKAGLTIVTAEVGVERASRHGVVERDGDRVTRFLTKPDEPPTGEVATEIFVYTAERLITELRSIVDDEGEEALGDFGDALVPRFVDAGEAYALPIDGYWRDVGTLEAYMEGHHDLIRADCDLTLDDEAWPILGQPANRPPARFLDGAALVDSLVSPGCVVAGRVERSVLGPGTSVGAGAQVVDSVVMENVVVAAGATVTRAIVAADATIGEGATVGGAGGELTVLGAGHDVDAGATVTPADDDQEDDG
jgi:glucose-1-phosphate adenylyltransferase